MTCSNRLLYKKEFRANFLLNMRENTMNFEIYFLSLQNFRQIAFFQVFSLTIFSVSFVNFRKMICFHEIFCRMAEKLLPLFHSEVHTLPQDVDCI